MGATLSDPHGRDDLFRLADFEVAPRASELRAPDGTVHRLEPKAMQVLQSLAAQAGCFVSKQQLLDTVWKDRFVTDDVLTGAVRALRKALADDPRRPRFIETRKGIGYRLLAPVQPVASPAPRDRGRLIAAAACAALLLVLAASQLVVDDQTPPRTLAVLPFLNLSEDTRSDYVADAMTEALILDLARIGRLQVVSRTSVMHYRAPDKRIADIARELGADLLVEGSVLIDGDQLRVTAQLIDGQRDVHLWAGKFDRRYGDLFDLQFELAAAVAGQIADTLLDERAESRELPTAVLQDYLEARYLQARGSTEALHAARAIYDALAESYPRFVHGQLGRAATLLALFERHELPPQALDEAASATRLAFAQDPDNAESHALLARISLLRDWDFTAAEQGYRTALALNPSAADTRIHYAWLLVAQRRYDEAAAHIDAIRVLDPLYDAGIDGARLLIATGRYADAVDSLEARARRSPDQRVLQWLSVAYTAIDRPEAAVEALIRGREAAGHPPAETATLRRLLQESGSDAVYRTLIADDVGMPTVQSASVHARIGDTDTAIALLRRAAADRNPEFLFVACWPEFRELTRDDRFAALLRQVDLPIRAM